MLNFLQAIIPDRPWSDGIDNVAFKIGDITVAWYGIFIFIGFSLAILAATLKTWKWYKLPTDVIYWYCIMLIPTAIVGARVWSYIIGDATDWSKFFDFEGLAVEGGVTLSVLLAFWWFPFFSKNPKQHVRDEFGPVPAVRQVSMWLYADACLPAILMGQVMGRWGNYFNQELYGSVVTAEWYQSFLNHVLPYMYVGSIGEWRHPLFLYESIINFIGFISIYVGLEFVKNRKAGDLGIIYFLWYGIVRLCLEPLREAQYTFILSYVLSGIWVASGIALIVLNHTVFWKIRKFRSLKILLGYVSSFFKMVGLKISNLFISKNVKKVDNLNKRKVLEENVRMIVKKNTKTNGEMFYYRGL